MPQILSKHLAGMFTKWFFIVLSFFSVIVIIFDYIELLRRVRSRPDITFGFISKLVLFHYPNTVQQLMPFIVLFASMLMVWRLGRTAQLAVIRSTGISIRQLLFPLLGVVTVYCVLDYAVLNPLGASMMEQFEKLDNKVLRGQTNAFAVSDAGLWVRHEDPTGYAIVRISYLSPDQKQMRQVSVYQFDASNIFEKRYDAAYVTVYDRYWKLHDVLMTQSNHTIQKMDEMNWSTELDLAKVSGKFLSPDTLSVWELPHFISILEKAGLSSVHHRLYWNSLLARPLILCAMVFLGFIGSHRSMWRQAGYTYVFAAILISFLIYIFFNVSNAFGISATIPVPLAAWAPSGISLFLLLAYLLHLEES